MPIETTTHSDLAIAGSTEAEKPLPRRRRWRRWLTWGALSFVIILLAVSGLGLWMLRSSLPVLDGKLTVEGLDHPVTIDRDAFGVPTIASESRTDTAFALGFLHAQDRFFQMDLLRRMSSGRLSELFGEAALGSDVDFRKHRFSALAEQVVATMPENHRTILSAYTQGVNFGLGKLGGRPVEYLIFGQDPAHWQDTDSILVMMTMMCDLQPMNGDPERSLGLLRERVPDEVFQFLIRDGSQWDAPLDDSYIPMPPIPSAETWSMRDAPQSDSSVAIANPTPTAQWWQISAVDPEFRVGSNNWAVGKAAGRDGRGILASDMHLGLRVPATWYRAVMQSPTIDGTVRRLVGVTLPGAPVLIEGSNESVAWGFTNSYGDFGDVIELMGTPDHPKSYLTLDGPMPLETFTEEIRFPTGSKTIEYEWSRWGPVVEVRDGRKFVHKWIGHDPAAFDLAIMELESARNVDQAIGLANRAGMPNQNVMITDSEGNIAWTLSGRIPKRSSPPSIVPVDWSEGRGIWEGYLPYEAYPRVINPSDARLWSANNRILGNDYLNTVGNGQFDPGARARQIRDRLREKEQLDEKDLLAIQLDDGARFMAPWRDRMLAILAKEPDLLPSEWTMHLERSSDRASIDAVGYRIVHEFRSQVIGRLFGWFGSRRASSKGTGLHGFAKRANLHRYVHCAFEDVTTQLLEEQPEHWLPDDFATWDALLSDAIVETKQTLASNTPIAKATWGARNRAAIHHPLAMAIPSLAFLLSMPSVELPGDNHMPRVQSPSGGASQRMVVSPGHEELGIYHQPGGQSGHPLSPYYRAGFDDWARGNASPLLPGPSQHRLTLKSR